MPGEFMLALPLCPKHACYGYNGRLYCWRCEDEGRDGWRKPWKREWRRVRRAKRRAWKRWKRELGR